MSAEERTPEQVSGALGRYALVGLSINKPLYSTPFLKKKRCYMACSRDYVATNA